MHVVTTPSYPGGLEILCRAHAFLSVLSNTEGVIDRGTLVELFDFPTSPFPEMVGLIADRVSKLDNSNPEVAKVGAILAKLQAKPYTAETLCQGKQELIDWVDSYETDEVVLKNEIFIETLKKTSIVMVKGVAAPLPANAYPVEEINQLIPLILALFAKINVSASESEFWHRVHRELMQLVSIKDGRTLIQEILAKIGDKQITILLGDRGTANLENFHITLAELPSTSVYACPHPSIPGTTLLKSVKKPRVITLAHELIHILHSLNGCKMHAYPEGTDLELIYTSREEERTIRGFPISENSIADALNMYPRYGHIRGNNFKDEPESHFGHLIKYAIHGDFDWIAKRVPSPSSLRAIHQKTCAELREELPPGKYAKTEQKLKRKLEEASEPNIRPVTPTRFGVVSPPPVTANRIALLEQIQKYMVDNELMDRRLFIKKPKRLISQ
jgi:hypothetical protein